MFSLPTLRHVLPALALGLIASLAPVAYTVVEPPRADATSTYLCTGYAGCKSAGYSDSGYGANNGRMYWRMYSGHNCTNYVAYRMIQAGLSSERPWSSTGMAYNWGFVNASKTDRTPAVGAVAWWNRNVVGAGSSGHVAYVEKVISKNEIVISEDSWSGDFHWRRIYNTGSGWPSGFIHFRDRATFTNKTAPAISGTAQVGEKLVADRGTWSSRPGTVRFQWLAAGTPIQGATNPGFTPRAEELGKALSVRVTAARSSAPSVAATSSQTSPVATGTLVGAVAPTLSGDPVLGQSLTASQGTWSHRPDTRTYRWTAGRDVVARTEQPTLKLTAAMVGRRMSVYEVGRKAGYSRGDSRSSISDRVVRGLVEADEPFQVAGTPARRQTLVVTPGTVSPAGADVSYAWLRDGVAVPEATGTTYRLSADDVGTTITLQVTASKPDYRTLVQSFDFGGPVTTQPLVTVHARGASRAATVTVRVRAAGVESPGGTATIRVGKQATVSRQVAAGILSVALDDVAPGQYRVWVDYAGTSVIQPGRTQTKVTIRR